MLGPCCCREVPALLQRSTVELLKVGADLPLASIGGDCLSDLFSLVQKVNVNLLKLKCKTALLRRSVVELHKVGEDMRLASIGDCLSDLFSPVQKVKENLLKLNYQTTQDQLFRCKKLVKICSSAHSIPLFLYLRLALMKLF